MGFRGIAAVTLDVKGRITMPVQHRDKVLDLGEGAMVATIDTEDRCLLLYPEPHWQQIEEKLQELPTFNAATRRIQRLLIGHACDISMDRHGRLLIPTLLRDYAGLDKTIMLVGQGQRFELWGDAQWELGRDSWLAADAQEDAMSAPELMSLSL
jgi:MraZ protein